MKVCASLDPQGGPRNEQLQQRSGRREGRTQHDRAHEPAETAATGSASEHDLIILSYLSTTAGSAAKAILRMPPAQYCHRSRLSVCFTPRANGGGGFCPRHRRTMESNDFDGAMRQKERVRAPRRRQVPENEDEESVRRTSQVPPCRVPLSDTCCVVAECACWRRQEVRMGRHGHAGRGCCRRATARAPSPGRGGRGHGE
jgi:hypothetical protein